MLSENLKRLRKEKKLSLRALSEKAEVSKSTLNDIENNNVKSTTINTLEKIADALGVSVSYLICESIDYILETRLEDLGITFEDLAKQTGLSVQYLEGLGSIVPNEWDYQKVKRIANILKLNPEYLITALAKLEPPIIDDPFSSTAEEDFVTEDPSLSETELFTLAARIVDYEEPLTELDIEKMKLALKVALGQK
ncbi:hypothetical protein JCM14036_14810 [Desulfotomaculum defluvii]